MSVRVQVWRQSGPTDAGRFETFSVSASPEDTLTDALRAIAAHPVTESGERSSPVVFEAPRVDGSRGECAVLVDGRPRLPSEVRLAELGAHVVLSPLSKFPVERDLAVDLGRPRADRERVVATVPAEARATPSEAWAACVGCGACLEACPQYGVHSSFVGATTLEAVARYDATPEGRRQRLQQMVEPGGVEGCGNAMACVDVCPSGIPLATAIGRVKRATIGHWLRSLLSE